MSEPIYSEGRGWSTDGIYWHQEKAASERPATSFDLVENAVEPQKSFDAFMQAAYESGVAAERQRVLGLLDSITGKAYWADSFRKAIKEDK